MKSLYESILDDEDIFITRAIETAKNPFYTIFDLYKKYNDLMRYKTEILELFKGCGLYDLTGNYFWCVGNQCILMRKNNKTLIEPIYFKVVDRGIYLYVDTNKMRLSRTLKELDIKYDDLQKFIRNIIKKFKFKLTEKDINRYQHYLLTI